MSDGQEPDAATIRAAVMMLFHDVPPEQQAHMVGFLLGDIECLYVAAGRTPPRWVGALRQDVERGRP